MEILNLTTDTFVPASSAPAGAPTVTTNGAYIAFSADAGVTIGDYLCDASQKESRRINYISRDNPLHGTVEKAFTADLSGVAAQIISKSDLKILSIGVSADQSTNTEVNGGVVTDGTSVNVTANDAKAGSGLGLIEPIFVAAATVGACTVEVQRTTR